MADRIVLEGIEVEALIGVFEHERHAKRPLLVDLDLTCDITRAAVTDNVEDTIDYFTLTNCVREHCARSSYRLIEALAADIARICLASPRVSRAVVKVRKPGAVAGVSSIAVVIERSR